MSSREPQEDNRDGDKKCESMNSKIRLHTLDNFNFNSGMISFSWSIVILDFG